MRKPLSAMVLAVATVVASGASTVAQSKITSGDGVHLATGKITITATAAFQAQDGTWVETTPQIVRVINGSFSINLEPNDTGIPSGTSYLAKWELDDAAPRTDHWLIPTSGGTLTLSNVRVSIPPPVNYTVPLGQVEQSGASVGQTPCWTGTRWAPGNCASGGSGASWVVNTVPCSSSPIFDLSLGNVQQISLTCNVTSASILNLAANTVVMFRVCQSGTYSWTWPAAVVGGVNAGASTSGKCAAQWFYSTDGIHLQTQGIGVLNQ